MLDVDSHSICALLFEVPKNGDTPRIIKKTPITLRLASGGNRTAVKMRELILASLKLLQQVPKEIIVSMGPSIAEYKLEIWSVPFESGPKKALEKPLSATISEFRDEKTSQALFKKFSLRELEQLYAAEVRRHEAEHKMFAAELITIEANGYPSLPLEITRALLPGIAFRVFSTTLSEEVRSIFSGAKEMLGGIPLRFVASAAVLAGSIVAAKKLDHALLVEINDAETLLLVLKNGMLAGFSVFPFGAANFARYAANQRGLALGEAKETIRQAAYGLQLSPAKMEEMVSSAYRAWKKEFREALDSFYHLGPFSGDVLLSGEGAYILPLRSFLGSSEWLEGISYAATPRLRILDGSSFFEGQTFNGVLQGPENTELAALVYYALFHKPVFGV